MINKTLLILIILCLKTTSIFSQETNFTLGNCKLNNGSRLELQLKNDNIGKLTYISNYQEESYYIKYDLKPDSSITLYNPLPPETLSEYEYYIDTIERHINPDSLYLKVTSEVYNNGDMGFYEYTTISFDGINDISLKFNENYYFNKGKFDSIQINNEWLKIDTNHHGHSLFIRQTIYEPNTQTINYEYPNYFDSLNIQKLNGYWSIKENLSSRNYNLNLFKELRIVSWTWRQNEIVINKNLDHSFIEKSSIKNLEINQYDSHMIDLSDYTNLNQLTLNNPPENIQIKSNNIKSLILNCNKNSESFNLQLSQDSLHYLETNIPLGNTNLIHINELRLSIWDEIQNQAFLKSKYTVNKLYITYKANELSIEINANLASTNFILIEKDSINLNCSNKFLFQTDSLILYGFSANFDFLKCPHNLTYLGVFYSNEVDKANISTNYPTLKNEMWCFDSNNYVLLNSEKQKLHNVNLCDSILSISKENQLIKSPITVIEYHFNVSDSIIYFSLPNLLVSNNKYNYSDYNVLFTENHPFNTVKGNQLTINQLNENDEIILSNMNTIQFNQFIYKKIHYTGTLINIRTASGNYFINGISFMNK